MYELMVEDTFDAAHALRGYNGPCENLHGHTWKVQVFLGGETLNKLGLLEDFKVIKKTLKAILAEFDHGYLNELKVFKDQNPSSENLARIIYKKLKSKIATTSKVTVFESPSTSASYWN
jgi:6-pyruvoyltetrahydropterin/6-carboxytetrahydropterin synthase